MGSVGAWFSNDIGIPKNKNKTNKQTVQYMQASPTWFGKSKKMFKKILLYFGTPWVQGLISNDMVCSKQKYIKKKNLANKELYCKTCINFPYI